MLVLTRLWTATFAHALSLSRTDCSFELVFLTFRAAMSARSRGDGAADFRGLRNTLIIVRSSAHSLLIGATMKIAGSGRGGTSRSLPGHTCPLYDTITVFPL